MNRKAVALVTTLTVFVLTSTAFSGCDLLGRSGDDARVTVYLTDMPFPFDDALAANVTVERLEIIGRDTTESIVLSDSVQAFNLLLLRDGVVVPIGALDIPQGRYSQLRLIVGEDASVVMKDSTTFDLKVPSGSQTGIKINLPDVDLGSNDAAEIVVDFNVEESFVVLGNTAVNGFIFKPVLKILAYELNGAAQALPDTSK